MELCYNCRLGAKTVPFVWVREDGEYMRAQSIRLVHKFFRLFFGNNICL